MPQKRDITLPELTSIDFYHVEYIKRYARQSPCSNKEMAALLKMLDWTSREERDTAMMLYMLDRVGMPSYRGEGIPYFPELPRK